MDSFEAEQWVARQLQKKGCDILRLNYRCIGAEIDILALAKSTLLVVEVKLRKQKPRYQEDFIRLLPVKKRKCLRRGVEHFITNHKIDFKTIRFDLAIVVARQHNLQLDLFYFYDL